MNTSPSEPLWLDLDGVLKTHEEQIELFGGAGGVRDRDVLTLAVRLGINGYVLAMPGDTTPGVLFEAAVTGDITEAQLIEDLYPYVQAFDF